MSVRRGDIVRSLKGHDAGGFFYVLEIEGEFLFLADGKRRSAKNPKKKRLRHAALEGDWTHRVSERIQQGEPVLDSEIRRALAAFREKKFSETKEV